MNSANEQHFGWVWFIQDNNGICLIMIFYRRPFILTHHKTLYWWACCCLHNENSFVLFSAWIQKNKIINFSQVLALKCFYYFLLFLKAFCWKFHENFIENLSKAFNKRLKYFFSKFDTKILIFRVCFSMSSYLAFLYID